MYTLTALDKEPRELFGKTYFWSPNEAGTLELVSLARLNETLAKLKDGLTVVLDA